MKRIDLIRFLAVFVFVVCLTLPAAAQRKRSRTVPDAPAPTGKARIKAGAEQVSVQIKNTTRFLYTLGGVAKGIEDVDKAVREGKASREDAEKNREYKRGVIQSIRNLRAGIVALESEFRTTPELQPYIIQIQGISNICATAEDQARDGRFTESGRTLLFVVEKLSDTLVAMP